MATIDDIKRARDMAKTLFDTNSPIISANAYNAAQSAAVQAAQGQVEEAVRQMSVAVDRAKMALSQTKFEAEDAQTTMTDKHKELADLKSTMEKERAIAALRKEQANELQKRDEGNFHTSWMGLLRPMKSESRVGLTIAAVGFFVLAILGFYYAFVIGLFPRRDAAASSVVPDFSNIFRGGALGLKLLRRR